MVGVYLVARLHNVLPAVRDGLFGVQQHVKWEIKRFDALGICVQRQDGLQSRSACSSQTVADMECSVGAPVMSCRRHVCDFNLKSCTTQLREESRRDCRTFHAKTHWKQYSKSDSPSFRRAKSLLLGAYILMLR